jgi:transcriptional regulator with XRE-family HTH domain
MHEAGRRLKKSRERLCLKYRDVEEASHHIARQHANQEFSVGLSRLADIENKGTVPSIYRLYSLCTIYGLDLGTVFGWYGVNLQDMVGDASRLSLQQTRIADFDAPERAQIELPVEFAESLDFKRTSYVSRHIHRWGKLPVLLLNSLDLRAHRYAFIGTEDWFMHPVIRPGSFVQIDEGKRRVKEDTWRTEHERPIYLVEHRAGFRCGWCSEQDGTLILQPHSASRAAPELYRYPGDAEIVGQVVGVAMRLDLEKRRHTRS